MQKKLPISLIVITYNDAERLEKLILKHKDLVEEVIVVDQGSTDNTSAVCEKFADLTFHKRRKGVSDPDRLWAHSLGGCPYVLYLDTDEYLSNRAIEALPKIVEGDFDVVWFNRKNLVDGVDICAILGKDPQLRLFKRGAVRYPPKDHTYPEVANSVKALHLDAEIIHERSLEGLKKANKSREKLYTKQHVEMQNRFIEKVEGIVTENKGFTENWYSNDQLVELAETCKAVRDLSGDVIEIGCWEGKSTCIIANALLGDTVIAVDTWKGNLSEGDNHPSVIAAQQRDVLSRFTENVAKFTKGNVQPVVSDCFEFLKQHKQKVKFAHLDAGHDYASVKNAIEMLKPLLVRGAVLCGDDFMSANATRADLGGGVEKAVTEACPGFVSKSNFWYWINK